MNYELFSKNRNLRILLLGTIFAVVAFFFLDHPLGVWLHQKPFSGDIQKFIDCGELFGHGTGMFVVAALIYVLDQANRRKILRVIACAYLPGLAAVLIKTIISRVRPRAFDFSLTIDQTFKGWAWLHERSSDYQSFPSGHTATAVGLAIGLSWLYPHGRKLFLVFAVWVAVQRMVSEAHYLSDTICAAMLAYFIAGAIVGRQQTADIRIPVNCRLPSAD